MLWDIQDPLRPYSSSWLVLTVVMVGFLILGG